MGNSYCIIWTILSKVRFCCRLPWTWPQVPIRRKATMRTFGQGKRDRSFQCVNMEHKELRSGTAESSSFSSSAPFTFEPLAVAPFPPGARVDPSASTAAVHATFSSAHRDGSNRRGRRPDRSCPTCKASVRPMTRTACYRSKGSGSRLLAKLILQNRRYYQDFTHKNKKKNSTGFGGVLGDA